MMRSQGSEGIGVIECTNPKINRWRVRWDITTTLDEETGESRGVSFMEEEITGHRPTVAEIKSIVIPWYNKQIDEKILSGYVWKENPVWLSSENQFNYKAAYDLAIQTEGATLPVTFKFGTDDEPVYHSFTSLDELKEFYQGAMAWVNRCLAEGWQKKDGIDWEKYEE